MLGRKVKLVAKGLRGQIALQIFLYERFNFGFKNVVLQSHYVALFCILEKRGCKHFNRLEFFFSKFCNLAEKYGLQHYVFNEAIYNLERHTKWYNYLDKIAAAATYLKHPAFAGHFLADEPSSSEMTERRTAYKNYYNAFSQYYEDPSKLGSFINLLPNTAALLSSDSSYNSYVKNYVENIAVNKDNVLGEDVLASGYVSYDHYPLKDSSIEAKHLRNLEIVAGYAKQYDLVFRAYIKASETGDSERNLRKTQTINDLYMQIYSALCFGVNEVIYYQFTDQHAAIGSAGDGVINGATLDTTAPVYQFAKQANNEIHAFDAAYNNFKWKSVSVFHKSSSSWSQLTQFKNIENNAGVYGYIANVDSTNKANVLIGNFDNKKKDAGEGKYGDAYAYMIQNYGNTGSSQAESAITITFNGTPTRALVYENGVAKVVTLTNNQLTLNLELGEGAFVIPLK